MAPLRRARAALLAVALTAGLALTACTSPTTTPAPSTPEAVVANATTLPGAWITGNEVKSPDTPYLVIYKDGSWRGSDGCNGASGTWSIDDNGVLTNTEDPHTLIYCDGEALPTAFVNAHAAVFADDQLRLIDDDGQTLYVLKQTDDVPTPVRGTADVVGWWGSDDTTSPRQIFLDLTSDGKYTGNDGCNTFSGTWQFADSGAVALSPIVIPVPKECPGFTPWISSAAGALVDGDNLVVTNNIGLELGHFTRSAVPSTNNPTPTPATTVGKR